MIQAKEETMRRQADSPWWGTEGLDPVGGTGGKGRLALPGRQEDFKYGRAQMLTYLPRRIW